MLKKFIFMILVLQLFGCAAKKQNDSGSKIILNSAIINKNPDDLAFWMMFAVANISCNEKHPDLTFGQFSCAFKFAMAINSNKNNDDSKIKPISKFSQDLAKISSAGFINEYIFNSYYQTNWFLEPGLDIQAYHSWMSSNLPNHIPSTVAAEVKIKTKQNNTKNTHKTDLKDDFRKSIANLSFEKKHVYDNPNLGVSVRYRITSNVNGWVDFYLYPIPESRKKLLDKQILADEATIAKTGLLYYAQQNGAKDFIVLEESNDPNIKVLKGRYQLSNNGALYIDELLLTKNETYFMKFRSTYLKGQREYSDENIKTIFDSLLLNLK